MKWGLSKLRSAWKEFKFGDFLQPNSRPYLLGAMEDANLVGVRWYGEGPFHRELKPALRIAKKSHFQIRTGDVIFNKLFAWKGSFGVVSDELDGMFVSDKFPTYDLDRQQVSERFLRWYFRNPLLWDQAREKSTGSAAISKLTLNPPKFLQLKMMAPERVEDQEAIAHRLDAIANGVGELRALRLAATDEIEALVVALHCRFAGTRERALGKVLTLDEDATRVVPESSYPQVGVRSFGGGLFPKAPMAGTDTTYRAFNRLHAGALLLSQVKGWEGAVAVCPPELEGWFASPEYRTFRCVPTECRPGYLAHLVRTKWFWARLRDATHGAGARRERTRPEKFLKIVIPMPDVVQQERAEAIFREVSTLKQLQDDTAAELDSLMPSALRRALDHSR